jgi:hypothetical protein
MRRQKSTRIAGGTHRAGLVLGGKIAGEARDDLRGLLGIGAHDRDHGGDLDSVMLGMPAIVVRHHRDGGVGDLGLARELGLRHGGHADHVVAEVAIGRGLRVGRKLRALHAHIGAARAERDLFGRRGGRDAALEKRADRVRHGDVGDAAAAEEGALAPVGPVHELVDEDEEPGIVLRLKGAAGGHRDQVGDAHALHGVDIGAIVDIRGRKPVPAPVAGQKDHLRCADAADPQHVGRLAPRRRDPLLPHLLQTRQVVHAGPADHAQDRSCHSRFPGTARCGRSMNVPSRSWAGKRAPHGTPFHLMDYGSWAASHVPRPRRRRSPRLSSS